MSNLDDRRWQFFHQMLTIRRLEERLLDLYDQGLLFGTVHTCIGQETIPVGVVAALDREKDVIWSNHRGHGHYIAYCDDVEGLLAEIMGRSSGVCAGIGGTQHLHRENFYTNGVLGGTVPCGVGAAMAEKLRASGAISTIFLGDGALAQGVVYESMNLAALWQLPVLFVLENNGFAQSTPTELEHAGDLRTRADTFSIRSRACKADDVCEVYRAAGQAVGYVREQQRPYFLALETYRLGPHSKGDDTRSRTELELHRARDPLLQEEIRLRAQDRDRLQALRGSVENRIQAAVERALADQLLQAGRYSRA